MKSYRKNTEALRILSQVFSPPTFDKVVRDKDFVSFQRKINKYSPSSQKDNLKTIKSLYKSLQEKYRCEYIYKNSLFLDILKKYGYKDTLVINELKIGNSKADMVFLNGSIRIYEIKTELDNLTKLSKQLNDYQKIADKVYVVTDENHFNKLISEYRDSNIGIISFNKQNQLKVEKEAVENSNLFDFESLFKLLRKQEYLNLTLANFGYIPDIPNTRIFKTCFSLLKNIDILEFQKQVLDKLKERKLQNPELLTSRKTPKELKYLCNSLDFNKNEYEILYEFLSSPKSCINHM